MHSSRMRTGRSLTICLSQLQGEGEEIPKKIMNKNKNKCFKFKKKKLKKKSFKKILGGVCFQGGCLLPGGVSAPGGSAPMEGLVLGGVCSWREGEGESAPGGGYSRGVTTPRGVSAPGGSAPRGVCFWGGCLLPL